MARRKKAATNKSRKLFRNISSHSDSAANSHVIPFRNNDVPEYLKNLDKAEERSKKSRIEIG